MAKTFSIERYAYCRTTEKYCAEFTEEEINDYIDGMNERSVVGETKIPHLTLEQVSSIWDEDESSDEFYNMKVEIKKYYSDRTYTESVGSIIRDYLNDCVWDGYVDMVDSETDDWEDESDIYGED